MRMLVWAAMAMALGVAGNAVAQATLPASPIPADAAVIFATTRDHETDPWGLGANALYVANLKGQVTRITHSKFFHNHFSVAPNRRLIATNRYSRGDTNHDGKYFPMNDYKELWVVDTVTGKERRIIPEIDAGYGGLAWSPDSKWIYFSSPTGKGNMDLRRVNIETEKVEVLTAGLNRLLGLGDAPEKFVSDLDVSDDGQWMVFLYSGPPGTGPGKSRIAVMKVDGTAAHIVSDGGPLAPGRRGVWSAGDFDPDFAPDGKHIAFAQITDAGMVSKELSSWDVITIDVDGRNEKDISPKGGPAAEFIPSWDARGIVFTRLDPKVGMSPVIYDPKTGARTPISIGGEGSHVQWVPQVASH